MKYTINKGIGRSVEFKGLKAQYLFLFAGGLLAVFVLLVIFYTAGVDQWACIGFGAGAASALVFYTFRMNAKLRRARTDETRRRTPPSPLPDKPQRRMPLPKPQEGGASCVT